MNPRKILFSIRLWLYQHMPIKKKQIVFLSHLGRTYGCNPRYLCEYLAANYPGEFDLVWIYDKTKNVKCPKLPEGVRALPYFSHSCIRTINSAKFIVSNTRIYDGFFFKKREGQKYIQTWHSSLRLKCIEADADLGSEYEEFAQRDSAKIDVIFSGCEFSSKIFRNSFWYDGKVINSGTPRIDWLKNINSTTLDSIYKKSGLLKDSRYVLYAPTFRKGATTKPYIHDFEKVCGSLNQRYGGQWKILYRLHPNLRGDINLDVQSEDVINMTDYDDIQELLAISDILITDYSSSMFDALLCDKKCILYTSDLEQYISTERRLYFEIGALPFPIAHDETELIKIIQSFDDADYNRKTEDFIKNIESTENGKACEKITEYILNSAL